MELQITNLQKVCLHSPPIHNLQGEFYKHKILMYEENPSETKETSSQIRTIFS